ncbi:MAG: MarR family transcriptional regulator [Spirochaetes bacterium]|nr:MarR family transcriptional regulator [Spirochaetota bacterium]
MSTKSLDENIVALLDKISDIRRALLWKISEEYSLTPLQIQILKLVKNCYVARPVTPTNIVKDLYVSKATASSALKTLLDKELVIKHYDESDNRSYYLTLTKKAERLLRHIDSATYNISQYISQVPVFDKKIAFKVLTQLVTAMQNDGAIDYIALCIHCEHCTQISTLTFRCQLTGRNFEYDGINVGCCNFSDRKAM